MPRRRDVPKRRIIPDPKHNDRLVAKFTNVMMQGGKKGTAEHILYRALSLLGERGGEEPLSLFKKGVDNVKPLVEVKSRRVGGATYQVPIEVRADRRTALALRWIITYARERTERTMAERLANELLDASQNRGSAVKKKEDTHKMADANKAFAHFRW